MPPPPGWCCRLGCQTLAGTTRAGLVGFVYHGFSAWRVRHRLASTHGRSAAVYRDQAVLKVAIVVWLAPRRSSRSR